MDKQAFLGAAVKKASGAIFGSPEKSLASNAVKATGLAVLGTAGAKTPVTSTLNQSGKGFQMTKTANLTGLKALSTPKAPSLKGATGLKSLPTPAKATGSIAPVSSTSTAKSHLGKVGTSEGRRNLRTLGLIAGGAGVIKGIDKAYDSWNKYSDKKEFGKTINHARKVNPALKKVPTEKMQGWMNSLYSLAPEITKDKGLASSMMSTVHNYGGDIDLATAKIISEVGHRSKRDGGKVSDLVSPSMSLFLAGK